jgi:hypothetical protein
MFVIAMTLVAYLFVLGAATPVFRVAYLLIPGMSMFRFPTRFLIVVELGLGLLGAIGLTRLRGDVARRMSAVSQVPALIAIGICTITAIDLWFHQPRQNPMVPAGEWLAAPRTVGMIKADTPQPRTLTPRQRDLHRRAFLDARGWADVRPYYELRTLLQPNIGAGFWGIPSADCYAGVAPRWYTDVWGDHNREDSILTRMSLLDVEKQALLLHPGMAGILKAYGVTHVLSGYPLRGAALPFVGRDGSAFVYRVDDARRVRLVREARVVKSDAEAATRLLDGTFDPDAEVFLHDAAAPTPLEEDGRAGIPATEARAVIARETQRELIIQADTPLHSYLLLADTYYPGWRAEVDGRPTPVYRANLSVRAIQLPKGRHEVRFIYDAPGVATGLRISGMSITALLVWVAFASYLDRRERRYRNIPSEPHTPITA